MSIAWATLPVHADITLQQCHDAATHNYPEIKRHELVTLAADYDMSNARKAHLPQVQAYMQATWQSAVSRFPDAFENMYAQLGISMKGMSKDQYKVGVEASQTIWDGGKTKAQIESIRAQEVVNRAKSDLTIYQVRQKVNDLYFGVLMLEANLLQNEAKLDMLKSNSQLLHTYADGGVASVSDAQRVDAELAVTRQQRHSIEETCKAYRHTLSLFTGMNLAEEKFIIPANIITSCEVSNRHPQLQYLDAQKAMLEAQKSSIKASLMPQLAAFGTAYYGKPGFNMFDAMFENKFSFNLLVGVKASWNIGALYSHKNNIAKIANARQALDVARENFLFNTNLQTAIMQGNIAAKQKELAEDDAIIELRESVRKATEAKLQHGIIVPDELIKDVSAEHLAKLAKSFRELEILKNEYDIKYATQHGEK